MWDSTLHAWRAFRSPIAEASRSALARVWDAVPERLRSERQFLGRQYAGCGATIGAMPRCDFSCRGCYLGASANAVPALPVEALIPQLETLAEWLGPGGNLQLTDGEVALRDPDEVVQLVRRARELELVPMLMSHGESFRLRPEKLEHLMVEGGLRELSIHIDTTQRGRREATYAKVDDEVALMPLRDEFADLIRSVRRRTGLPLHVASTVTVTQENLSGVASIVAWFVENADAFSMVSFQPVAAVGRTREELRAPVAVEALWKEIALGLGHGDRDLGRAQGFLGDPDCSRFVQGAVWCEKDRPRRFEALLDGDDARDSRLREALLAAWGGLTFRRDSRRVAIARGIGLALRHPRLAFGALPAWGNRWTRRVTGASAPRALATLVTRRARVHYLNIVSHHFMNRDELESDRGQEREATCVFKVAVDGELHSMCRVNATELREELYARFTREYSP